MGSFVGLFARSGSTVQVIDELPTRRIQTKKRKPFDKGYLYRLPHNRVYRGLAVHKADAFPGEHTQRKDRPDLGEADVTAALARFYKMSTALIPAEQARVVQLLVACVTVSEAGGRSHFLCRGGKGVAHPTPLRQSATPLAKTGSGA